MILPVKDNLRVGMVTTWGVRCGVAEYSANLVRSLRQNGMNVNVLANKTTKLMGKEDEDYVKRLFWVKFWENRDEADPVPLDEFDVVHFQIQSALYRYDWLYESMASLKERGVRTIATFHDRCIWPSFPYQSIDVFITHVAHMLDLFPPERTMHIPIGIPEYSVKLCSFGLGRSLNDQVRAICDSLGYEFYVHNPDKNGWLNQDDLVTWIRQYDGVVLWYPDEPMAGTSMAARVAIAARRPLFVSNTQWFRELDGGHIFKFSSLEDLKKGISFYYDNSLINVYGWNKLASRYEDVYGGSMP